MEFETKLPKSPRPSQPVANQGTSNPELVVRLLTEIRDSQRESLELIRESTLKQRRATRYSIPLMIVSFLILGGIMPLYVFYNTLSRARTVAPFPTRTPVVAPR